jgi:hypothetical protein
LRLPQALIYKRSDVELSAYRLIYQQRWHVSVLGDVPPAAVDKRVRQILSTGEAASLPDEILKALNHRRLLAKQIQPWVEAHHRPGMIFDVGDRVGMLPPPDGR